MVHGDVFSKRYIDHSVDVARATQFVRLAAAASTDVKVTTDSCDCHRDVRSVCRRDGDVVKRQSFIREHLPVDDAVVTDAVRAVVAENTLRARRRTI